MAAGLMSCAKEISGPEQDNTPEESVPMTFNITVDETKAPKTGWADGDKIYVFFRGLKGKYLILEYNGSGWSNTSGGGTLQTSDFAFLHIKTLTAIHLPVEVDVTYEPGLDAYEQGWFHFSINGEPVYTYYLYQANKPYTVSNTTVTATLSLSKPADMVQFHVAGIQDNVSDYTFGCSKIIPAACESVGSEGNIFIDNLNAGDRVGGFSDSDGVVFAGRLTTTHSTDYYFYLADNNYIYGLTRWEKTLTAGKRYNFPAPSVTGGANWNITAVNIGITHGGKPTYWTMRNVGATTETDYGNYVAWGEVIGYNEGKTEYTLSTYSLSGGVSVITGNISYEKYTADKDEYDSFGEADGKSVLEYSDDAAHFALDGNFHTPTKADFEDLFNLPNEWVDDYNGSGIAGYTFTGNGNTIFLPAAGKREYSNLSQAGFSGYYWTSSLDSDNPARAWSFEFYPGSLDFNNRGRPLGLSIRPVSN